MYCFESLAHSKASCRRAVHIPLCLTLLYFHSCSAREMFWPWLFPNQDALAMPTSGIIEFGPTFSSRLNHQMPSMAAKPEKPQSAMWSGWDFSISTCAGPEAQRPRICRAMSPTNTVPELGSNPPRIGHAHVAPIIGSQALYGPNLGQSSPEAQRQAWTSHVASIDAKGSVWLSCVVYVIRIL